MILPEKLREILTTSGFITESDFDEAIKSAKDLSQPVEEVLVFKGLISEDALGKLIAEHFGVGFVTLRNKVIPIETLEIIPEQAALSFHIIPFELENGIIKLGMVNPKDIEAIEFVKRKTNLNVLPHYITPADFNKTIGQYKKNIKAIFDTVIEQNINKASQSTDLQQSAEEVPVIQILDTILEYASAEGASDIHINMLEEDLLIRFRVDGILKDIANLPKKIHPALVARIKIISGLKIDEHRIPQDGRFKFNIHEQYISLRVSVIPSFFGENVVMRLLAESARALSLEELGISGNDMPKIKNNITKPNGMILVTGPTGSGKTTTLYSVLNMLNTPKVNICTIEDPVEYSVRRINQTQVNTKAGLDFAAGLRALLRHDPDVIMIGEIRDAETAEIAIHSALTGHLVLSTLHTNSAAGAIPRFIDMGAEGFLVASTVNIIIAQRLVRKICTNCIHRIDPPQDLKDLINEKIGTEVNIPDFFSGEGCSECDGSGYKGRVGIYEIVEISPAIRDLITRKVSAEEIQAKAHEEGMTSLMRDGLDKVSAGITTIQEVIRVTTA